MKSVFIVLVVVCLMSPVLAQAQVPTPNQIFVSCGKMEVTNTSHQFGHFGLWLEYIVSTTREVNACPITLSATAHVVGVSNSALARDGLVAASANRQIPVPYPGRWETKGAHGFTFWAPALPLPVPFSFPLPETASLADIRLDEPTYDPAFECEIQGGRWLGECQLPNCPLIVDMGRDGYALTSVENGVRFDLDADGIAEQVAWTKRNSDEAFLALDRNGNGRIDNGSELFGNHTPAYPDGQDITTANGFEALKFVEMPEYGTSRRDGIINARDAVFRRLLLWRDRNHNGISEPDELERASQAGLQSIGTEYKNRKRVDRHGNEFRQRGEVTWRDGQVDHLFDIWLMWRN